MKARRGATELSGIIAVDKPAGVTSHDVISALRRISGERRVGHCGTLDPFATGLLLVCVGPATRLSTYLTAHSKNYKARVAFGSSTDTDDATGVVIQTAPVPDELSLAEFAREYLVRLVGTRAQVPPSYSAIKKDGVRSYDAARHGKTPVLEARIVKIHSVELIDVVVEQKDTCRTVYWDLAISVSKGTYIRALARDIACDLGTCGHLALLQRTCSGSISLDDAYTLQQLEELGLEACYLNPLRALGLPELCLGEAQREHVIVGRPLAWKGEDASLLACTYESSLLALYAYDKEHGDLRARTVIPGGARGLGEQNVSHPVA